MSWERVLASSPTCTALTKYWQGGRMCILKSTNWIKYSTKIKYEKVTRQQTVKKNILADDPNRDPKIHFFLFWGHNLEGIVIATCSSFWTQENSCLAHMTSIKTQNPNHLNRESIWSNEFEDNHKFIIFHHKQKTEITNNSLECPGCPHCSPTRLLSLKTISTS